MSGITVGDLLYLLWDCKNSAIICRGDVAKIEDVKIVPRKIVEMIIEKCTRDEEVFRKFDWNEAADTSHNVKVYAESLLKQFEEDNE